MTITELVNKAHALARSKGWHDKYDARPADGSMDAEFFATQIALIASESSEALEAYRARGLEPWEGPNGKPEGVGAEFADIVIRVADACGRYGIDLEAEIKKKHEYNITRSWKHGGKAC